MIDMQPYELMAFFVGGPMNGHTMYLPNTTMEYRFVSQATVKDAMEYCRTTRNAHIPALSLPYELYIRTHEMRAQYYKGCYIFEWIGTRSVKDF